MIIAGIDVGTNTFRLLVADIEGDSFRELISDRIITRLGEGLDRSGSLAPAAQERAFAAFTVFTEQLRRYPPAVVDAVGTSALRNASNAAPFIRKVESRYGFTLRVIGGDEEARLTLVGVEHVLRTSGGGLPEPSVVIDIGGGSTEVILSRGGEAREETSLPLGAVYLTERFIRHDPPRAEEIAAVRTAVSRELGRHLSLFRDGAQRTLIGTAGTITTLAAMAQGLPEYNPARINNYILSKASLDGMIGKLSASTLSERRNIKGLERGREDIILAGAIVIQEVLELMSLTEMRVSDWGLREGIVLDLYEKRRREAAGR